MSAPSTSSNATGSVPFVTKLRSRPGVITVGDSNASNMLHLRVEVPEVWDTIRIDAPATESVRAVKIHALQVLCPKSFSHDEYFTKLRGVEIFDETKSLQDAGAKDGSIFLVTHRRRRPVR